jgi:hypothetical protein
MKTTAVAPEDLRGVFAVPPLARSDDGRRSLDFAQNDLIARHIARRYERGFGALYIAHVTQANQGCDFDFLHAGAETPEPEIH